MKKFNLTITSTQEFYSPVCMATIPEHTEGFIEELGLKVGGLNKAEIITNTLDILKGKGLHGTLHVES